MLTIMWPLLSIFCIVSTATTSTDSVITTTLTTLTTSTDPATTTPSITAYSSTEITPIHSNTRTPFTGTPVTVNFTRTTAFPNTPEVTPSNQPITCDCTSYVGTSALSVAYKDKVKGDIYNNREAFYMSFDTTTCGDGQQTCTLAPNDGWRVACVILTYADVDYENILIRDCAYVTSPITTTCSPFYWTNWADADGTLTGKFCDSTCCNRDYEAVCRPSNPSTVCAVDDPTDNNNNNYPSDSDGNNAGAIVGGIFGTLIPLILICCCCYYCRRRRVVIAQSSSAANNVINIVNNQAASAPPPQPQYVPVYIPMQQQFPQQPPAYGSPQQGQGQGSLHSISTLTGAKEQSKMTCPLHISRYPLGNIRTAPERDQDNFDGNVLI